MNKRVFLIAAFGLVMMSACSSEETQPKEEGNVSEIHLTQQIDGIFKGYDGENQVLIEVAGVQKAYKLAGEVTGDLDKVESGDNVAFSSKTVNGEEVLETLRLN